MIYSVGALVLGGGKIQKPKVVHSEELLLELVITSEYIYSPSEIHHGFDIFKMLHSDHNHHWHLINIVIVLCQIFVEKACQDHGSTSTLTAIVTTLANQKPIL